MKYLSIDIETTGLDPSVHQILEMAAVLDDTEHPEIPVTDLPYFRALVLADNYTVNPYCAQLHSTGLWQEIMGDATKQLPHTIRVDATNLIYYFTDWLIRTTKSDESVFAAGKNFGAFDLQFLKKYAKNIGKAEKLPFKHRYFDPGCMYYAPGDTEIPSLPTCLSRAGLAPTNLHTALGDALDVIRVLRPKISKGAL